MVKTKNKIIEGEDNNALVALCSAIDKQFGDGTVITLNQIPPFDKNKVISSQSLSLDTALGVGGYARGRIIELYGLESSGKSTLCLHAVAEEQRSGGKCVFIDAEHSLDVGYASNIGVNVRDLLISQPDYGEQALEVASMMAKSGLISLIVIDSVAALTPKAEVDGEMGDQFIGLQARMMGQALRKLGPATASTNCTIIFTNQIRSKIGIMFGDPTTTPGGNALKHYASQRLQITRAGSVKSGDVILGQKTKVTVVKSKVSPPKKVAEFEISFGIGINKTKEILEEATIDGVVQRAGAWYSWNDTRIGQGEQQAADFLNEHPDVYEKIRSQVLEGRRLI